MFNLIFKLWYGRKIVSLVRELRMRLKLPDAIEFTFHADNSYAAEIDGIYRINIDVFTCWRADCSIEAAVAHEAKHIEQMFTGRLTTDRGIGTIYWDGVPMADAYSVMLGLVPYHRLPWEVEAILFETWFANQYGYKALKRNKGDT